MNAQTSSAAGAPASPQAPAASAASTVTLPAQEVDRMRHQLADWANLGRYHDDNASLAPPAPGEQRVVFMGDSITDNWGRLAGKFFPGKPYVNRGISGQTTPQMLVRFRQDVVALHPAAVLILAGINDIAGNTGPETMTDIENNFRSMVDIAKREHIRVILASTLPASVVPWRPGVKPADQVRELDAWLAQYAEQEHLVFCNYYPAMEDGQGGMRPELAIDKAVHPNDAGYAVMAPIAEAAIAKSLAEPRP
ncbi:capsular biosynthesis protein [Silvibacterium dinghuense]|uniref:Capsular biosynthesis protein n=2 Tax=Silvibacterium dinghuense TaxID=1560006 RepID=A0A4Q1S912_9BACT|nr:capsular biosynthesis protein [Silvibacterium dinghuense]